MYSAEYLSRYPFFAELLKTKDLPTLHDALTGVIARPHMIRFIQDLIRREVHFTLAIVDLDNFKSVNDNYGHRVGDQVLSRVSASLEGFVAEDGLVGRFGGDEFLILYFKSNEYDRIHDFFDEMYRGGTLFRKNVRVDELSLYLTATTGSASYPENAGDYDSLFALVDKTLYRGKSKGRNCYIIYVKEKHENLEIRTLARQSLSETFLEMLRGFDGAETTREKLVRAFAPASESLRIHDLFYVNGEGQLKDVKDGSVLAELFDWDEKTAGVLFTPVTFSDVRDVSPTLYGVLRGPGYQSVLLARVGGGKGFGYLVLCPEPHTLRIWQDDECAAALFLARLLADDLTIRGESLE